MDKICGEVKDQVKSVYNCKFSIWILNSDNVPMLSNITIIRHKTALLENIIDVYV